MTLSLQTCAVRLLLCIYLIEAAALLILVGVYKTPAYNLTLFSSNGGVALVAGVVGILVSGWLLRWQAQLGGEKRGRALAIALATNLIFIGLAFLLLEATVRIVSKHTNRGIVVGSVSVRPTWPELVAQSRPFYAGFVPWGTWDTSYFVYDRELGWTVGPNRQSRNGLYFSSVEGVRSPGPNVRFAERQSRIRVALIGDSNAFSFEVPFNESWGYHLQRLLGEDVLVLNFGVDGYGIDQTYLRFRRDVLPWNPQVVLIGFVEHDLLRTMSVYPFVSFGWPGYLVKPRYSIAGGQLNLLNVPLPTPEQILSTNEIQKLPYVDYDIGYATQDWEWQFDHAPLFVRVLTSVFPRWKVAPPQVSDQATKELNSRLFAQLVESVQQTGAVPIVVWMAGTRSSLVEETLAQAHVSFMDATDCLTKVPAEQRRVPSGHHYTGLANEAIARCTEPAVASALKGLER